MPKLETTVGASMADTFGAGKSAINTTRLMDDRPVHRLQGRRNRHRPHPEGPEGKRASMFNGLADSIWAGTKNPAASVKWVEYLASAACQDVVASKAVVFPAHQASSDKAAAAFKAKNIDVSAFTTHVKDKHHVPVPHR